MKHILPLALLVVLSMGCADEKMITTDHCPDDPNKTWPGECGCGKIEIEAPDGSITCRDASDCPADSMCDGKCVNLKEDPKNCGKCGTECGDNETCSNSECKPACEGDQCVNVCEKDGKAVTCDEGMTCKDGECLCGDKTCDNGQFCQNNECHSCVNATYDPKAKKCICNDGWVDMINFKSDYDASDKRNNYLCEQNSCLDESRMQVNRANNTCECVNRTVLVDHDNGKYQKACECDASAHWVSSQNTNMCVCDADQFWVESGGICVCKSGYKLNPDTNTCVCIEEDERGQCMRTCDAPLVWVPEANGCDCPTGYTQNNKKECVCDINKGYVSDEAGGCMCNEEGGWFLNPDTNICMTDCKSESHWDTELNTCVCDNPKKVWSGEATACVCDSKNGWSPKDDTACVCDKSRHWTQTEGSGNNSCRCLSPRTVQEDGYCGCNANEGWTEGDTTKNNGCVCDEKKGLMLDSNTCKCDAAKGYVTDKESEVKACKCNTEYGFSADENGVCVCDPDRVIQDGKCACNNSVGFYDKEGACECNASFGFAAPSENDKSACTCDEENGFILNEARSESAPDYCICKEDNHFLDKSDPAAYKCTQCPENSKVADDKTSCTCPDNYQFDKEKVACIELVTP